MFGIAYHGKKLGTVLTDEVIILLCVCIDMVNLKSLRAGVQGGNRMGLAVDEVKLGWRGE